MHSCIMITLVYFFVTYCKTSFFRVPFISRAWQVHENNQLRKFEYSSVSV